MDMAEPDRQMARERYRFLPLVGGLFVAVLVVSNIIAVKPVAVGPLVLPAAIVLFPLAYIIGDVLTEVYGFGQARRVIWIGFLANAVAVAAMLVGGVLPAAAFWGDQSAYDAILGATPRLLVASFLAYLVGELLNSYVLARLKVVTDGRHLWLRTISSTVFGQAADSVVFLSVAFAGVWSRDQLVLAIASQFLVKVAYEAVLTPGTYLVTTALKRSEGVDHYDHSTRFLPVPLPD